MSELNEPRWAVISERGREATGLRHEEAAGLMRRLVGERVSGLCVVTAEAAERLRKAARVSPNGKPATKKSSRRKRAPQK